MRCSLLHRLVQNLISKLFSMFCVVFLFGDGLPHTGDCVPWGSTVAGVYCSYNLSLHMMELFMSTAFLLHPAALANVCVRPCWNADSWWLCIWTSVAQVVGVLSLCCDLSCLFLLTACICMC